jgi:hypothetical protein
MRKEKAEGNANDKEDDVPNSANHVVVPRKIEAAEVYGFSS